MQGSETNSLLIARRYTLEAGRILRLIRFQVHAEESILALGVSPYTTMISPSSNDALRLAACRGYLRPVREQILLERLKAPPLRSSEVEEPYGVEMQTTQRGLLLIICKSYLLAAVQAFERSDGKERRRT
ncbi:MAG: hypothetical protein Q4G24_16235 [Paracoccus sp. (in: a-proteobacteria)]|uniref:hypothetical protein n=1 Tax=Paracoccus sp. TaxID=267 RepID=UPI0026DF292F|nr:hypothetical protein [Paracoccus sp. (in: a-proteobacteria)]MDO5622995.1 hypothetical protein [Paracoccus sp. (in: a-proteobacteria)]